MVLKNSRTEEIVRAARSAKRLRHARFAARPKVSVIAARNAKATATFLTAAAAEAASSVGPFRAVVAAMARARCADEAPRPLLALPHAVRQGRLDCRAGDGGTRGAAAAYDGAQVSGWKAGPEKPRMRFCWDCSRRLHGRVHAVILGEDGMEHDVHKTCVRGRTVIRQSTTVRP